MRNTRRVHSPRSLLCHAFALCALGVLGILLHSPDARAVGEQNGRVEGVVTDAQTGVPMPGATVKVTSKALIGGPRSVNTDDNGHYELVELPPGTYDMEIGYEGVKPVKRRFVVRQGQAVPMNVKWSVELAQQETTVVVEERHMTNPDSTQTGTVLTLDQESKVASGRRYQDVITQVAGVSSEQGEGNPVVKGATLLHNRYLVDGLDITDPVTNTFSANINFDSIASVEMLTGGMEAQYNSLGGVINLITAAGSNDWHIDSSFYIQNAALTATGQFGPYPWNQDRPFSKITPAPQQSYLANLNVGGPIVKNRLWFNFSFEYDYRESAIPAGPPLNLQHPPLHSDRYLMRLKLTYAPSAKHRITLSASADPAFFNHVDQFNGELDVAEDYQKQGGLFSILQWDYFANKNVNTSVQAGFQWSFIDFGPQGYFGSLDTSGYAGLVPSKFSAQNLMYDPNRPAQFNLDDGTSWYQGAAVQLDTRYTAQLDPSVSVRGRAAGYHDAKFGIQSRFIYHENSVHTPGGGTYSDAGGGTNYDGKESFACNQPVIDMGKTTLNPGLMAGTGGTAGCFQASTSPDFANHQMGFGIGAYAQDKWKPTSWLLIMPGLRFDYGTSWNSLGQQATHLFGFGPRLGFIFDLTRDQKTILSAFYGRSNETLSLLTASNADNSSISKTYQWDPNAKQFSFLFSSGGPNGYRIDPAAYTPPHSDEVTLSLRREVFANSVATVDYTYKHMANIWDAIEVNQVWDPTGTRVIGYANGAQPGTPLAQKIFYYTTPDQNQRTYQGIDFILESSPGKSFDVLASYTLSWLYGSGAEQMGQLSGVAGSQFYNPRMWVHFDGFLPEDHRHQIKIRASYTWQGLTLGANFNWQSGGVMTKLYWNNNDGGYQNRRSPQGTEPTNAINDPTQFAEFRTPDLVITDLRVQYDFHALIHQHLTVIADIFNLFNLNAATNAGGTGGSRSSQNAELPTFGTVTTRQTPLQAQFGLRYVY